MNCWPEDIHPTNDRDNTPGKTPLSLTDKTDKSPRPTSAVLLAVPDGVPPEWVQGVADLLVAQPHPAWKADAWKTLQDDALAFIRDWAAQAAKLGWDRLDLFGVLPVAPVARVDGIGLVPLLGGRPVVALSEDSAGIKTALTYRKHRSQPDGRRMVWELLDGGVA